MGLFLGTFAALLVVAVPIAMALGLASMIYIVATDKFMLMAILPQRMLGSVDKFVLLTIPLFLLAGNLMNYGGITDRILRFANACIGHLRGGMSLVNVVSSMFFGGISGAAAADTSALGTILIPAMKKDGYPPEYAAALTAVSSVIGSIIPPSIIMVLYGVLTNTSIAQLFIAGIVPGLMLGFGLMAYAWWVARRSGFPLSEMVPYRQRFTAFLAALPVLALPLIILGGILFGVFTPTESAAVAVIYALFIGGFVYRELSIKDLWRPLVATAIMTAGIMFIVCMASIVQFIFSFERIPAQLTELILGITENKVLLLLLINLLLLVLGMFLEPVAAMIISLPVLIEVSKVIGLDPVHFGIIVVLNLAIGLVTPPMGICLFIASAIGRVPLESIARASLPMIGVALAVLMLVSFVPDLPMFLPRLAFSE